MCVCISIEKYVEMLNESFEGSHIKKLTVDGDVAEVTVVQNDGKTMALRFTGVSTVMTHANLGIELGSLIYKGGRGTVAEYQFKDAHSDITILAILAKDMGKVASS